MDIVESLSVEGYEPIGTITLGKSVVVGDPAHLGAGEALRSAWSGNVRPGTWWLFLRADAEDVDKVVEIVAVHGERIESFFDAYDEAVPVGEVAIGSGRLAMLDAVKREDVALRKSMFEPEELPWVLDDGVVSDIRDDRARVFVHGDELVSVAFGPWSAAPRSALPPE